MEQNRMEGFCRGCLVKYDDPVELLQYTEKNRRLFIYCTGIQVKRNDIFTFQLCKHCYLNLKVACKFKKVSRTSDKKFRNYVELKNDNESMDFCTFLKNNEDALTNRFPLMLGNSTPCNPVNKDDDNESTCTSMRNFMSDILQGEEMPDTEARIIHEVIQEEADILDDTLDSYWLQDDVSIDTDFRLDFSFSPFSTPRSLTDNNCYSPMKHENGKPRHHYTNEFIEPSSKIKLFEINDDKIKLNDKDINLNVKDFGINDLMGIERNLIEQDIEETSRPNFYVSNDNFEESVQVELKSDKNIGTVRNARSICTIDRNLEKALNDESNKEINLDDLLLSSPAVQRESASSTPSITSILFGKNKRNAIGDNEIGQCIENFENVTGNDINIDEISPKSKENDPLFNEDGKNYLLFDVWESKDNEDTWSTKNKFDVDNSFCILCNKKFKNPKALRIHASKSHKIKIDNPKKKDYKFKVKVCDLCGKGFRGSANFSRHKKQHNEPKVLECDYCGVVVSSKSKMEMHMSTHTGKTAPKKTGKKYQCNICGAISNHYSNYAMHKRRHNKEYSYSCATCHKGFFRAQDLAIHSRLHTGERPYKCDKCPKSYSRRDGLFRHAKWHINERKFQCDYCNTKFITKMNLKHHIERSKKCRKIRGRSYTDGNSKTTKINVIYAVGSQDKIIRKAKSKTQKTSLVFVSEDSDFKYLTENGNLKSAIENSNIESEIEIQSLESTT